MVISPLSQLITMRLENDNFLMWKYQIENVRAMNFGSKSQVQNYQRQDHLLISWLLSSIEVRSCLKLLDTNHILAIMQGLGDESESVIAVISSKKYSPSLQYVTSTLIAHNRNQFGGNQVTRGSFVHNRGRGRGRAQGGIKPQCQLCNKFGHTVHRCFYRYDPNFHGNMPANGPTPGVLGSGARNGASGSISSAGNVNLTKYDAQEDQDYSEMEAMVATLEDLQNCCWFPDSGATNHVTHDLGNLNSGAEYNGNSKIHMGNGTGLKISHIGLSVFPSSSSPNKGNLHKGLYQFNLSKKLFGKASEPLSVGPFLSLPTSSLGQVINLMRILVRDIRCIQQDLSNTDSSSTVPILNESASIPSSSNLYALPGTIPLSTNSDEPNESINTRPVTFPQQPHHMVTRSKNGIFKPKVYTVDLNVEEPNTFQEAISHPKWKEAMDEEFRALMKNKTWSLVSLPTNRTSVGCRWVFKLKRNPDGSVSRYKARLVAKGDSQVPGFDFYETFSPVVKPTTIRVVLALDVNNAFLNGELQEEVYMDQPPGFDGKTNQEQKLVCKLHKALYGLKQAPQAWFDKLKISLQQFGFSSTKSDQSLFVRFTNCSSLFVLVYVDDIVVTGSSSQEIHELISRLRGLFSLKDLGELSYFLGIEYRSVVGALQYITITRPEIAFSVNKVCQFMQKPLDTHWKVIKRILRYLNGTTDLGIWGFVILLGSDVDDRRSTSGHCLQTKMTMVPVIWCDNIILFPFINPLVVNHVPTEDQVADVFTKPLSFGFFDKCVKSFCYFS
ncbi:hypothetical protein AAG906_021410 [Vitis piasezkii]